MVKRLLVTFLALGVLAGVSFAEDQPQKTVAYGLGTTTQTIISGAVDVEQVILSARGTSMFSIAVATDSTSGGIVGTPAFTVVVDSDAVMPIRFDPPLRLYSGVRGYSVVKASASVTNSYITVIYRKALQ